MVRVGSKMKNLWKKVKKRRKIWHFTIWYSAIHNHLAEIYSCNCRTGLFIVSDKPLSFNDPLIFKQLELLLNSCHVERKTIENRVVNRAVSHFGKPCLNLLENPSQSLSLEALHSNLTSFQSPKVDLKEK